MRSDSGDTILDHVQSLCPVCGDTVTAIIFERDGKVFQRPNCSKHPTPEALIFSDAAFYSKLDTWNQRIFPGATELPVLESNAGPKGCRGPQSVNGPTLAVIDITNRCNYSCPVCFAEITGQGDHYSLNLEQIDKMLKSLLERPDPCWNIQFSGGEPTLHPQFPEILRKARDLGFRHIQVATNGSRFIDPDYARLCEDSGLHTLYLQFDGMSDDVYRKLRGQPLLDKKIKIVENIAKTNMRIVLVPVIASSVNIDQIGPIFRFALEHSKHITGISIQPAALVGRVDLPDQTESFNLATMATAFGEQTGLTRFPDDWFPLNAVSTITRAIGRIRHDQGTNPGCDAHCSLGTFFCIDDRNQPHCLTRFFDLDRFFRGMHDLPSREKQGVLRQQISRLKELSRFSDCFDKKNAPEGLTFQRLLRSLDNWEDKSVGRGSRWFQRGFNGMFVAGMHFMDSRSYNFRRLQRCIIQYVTTNSEVLPFCCYNAGPRHRVEEEAARLNMPERPAEG
jgi:uncharacterized radical SAM superfamily Fe-S cluster-containing enzyme